MRESDERADVRDRAAELRDRGAEERDARAGRDEEAESERDEAANAQDQAWSDDDQASSGRDQRSADEDQRSADDAFAAGGDAATYQRGVAARDQSRQHRRSASVSRRETSAAREHEHVDDASRDRGALDANDRLKAADDRAGAADDRAEAVRDRTESAGAAQRALETLESMSDAFFTLDSDWRFTYLNPQCDVILERRREDLLGRSVWDAFPEAVGSRFDEEYRRALSEQTRVRFEERYEPLGRTLEVRAYPVGDGLAVYFTDVTDERLRDARLRQTERLEMLGQITAGVVHDFNNLLTAVGGFAKLGQRAAADEKTTAYFDQIDEASQRAVALTRQLLGFARAQVIAPAIVDVNEVVDGLYSLLRQLMPDGIELQLALSTQPVPVFVDRSQLEQVLLNLIVNGRDAINPPGAITISSMNDAPADVTHDVRVRSGWLQVTDTGSGIPEDVRPYIFDPFFSTKPPEAGTGLGLATIYGIVSKSGGSIYVDSAVGVGTTMTVALPAP